LYLATRGILKIPKNRKLSAKERKQIEQRLNSRYEALRKKYPEVKGKIVDFITHAVEDETLFFTVRFTDKTIFSLRYQCEFVAIGAERGDWKTGDLKMIRQYMKAKSES
jgi:hypothetical protein